MTCPNCNDEGRKVSTERKNKITYTVYTLCLCEIGQQLEKLWEQYPVWVGAPYSFFNRESCANRAGFAGDRAPSRAVISLCLPHPGTKAEVI